MFGMHDGALGGPSRLAVFALMLSLQAPGAIAAGLTLEGAEALALSEDPGLRQFEARQQVLEELAVAAEQLPDPIVKMGLVSLPTDTFDLGQEAMTQVQVGVSQKFPRGDSRDLRSQQLGLQSEGLDARSEDQARRIRLAVREQFIEVLKQQKLAQINREAIDAFAEVAALTRDYYRSGRSQQQDVAQALLEVARAEDRGSRIAQDEDQARARLARWIGDAAYAELDGDWPRIEAEVDPLILKKGLTVHPRVQALQKSAVAAEKGIDLARQRYKPEFGVDLTYGGRAGRNPDGSPRTDLLTFMVVMDVPLFTANRQDRLVAARAAESSAALFERDAALRELRSEVDFHIAALRHQRQRIVRFEDTLLPEAAFSSEASMNAFRSSVADLTSLIRARIAEFDLQLDHARVRAEYLKTLARLAYLEGDVS